MCDFLSWVETKDHQIFCLTDKEIFSFKGKRRLHGCRRSDFLGHAAIQVFFDLGEGRVEREERDFWILDRLPEELQSKVKDFDKYWGKTFKMYFYNDDLDYIIEYAPDEWREKAWQQLLKQAPSDVDLCRIIEHAPDEWKTKASEQLLRQKPSNNDFVYIIVHAPDEWREKAWKQLLKQAPSNGDLCRIIEHAPDEWREKAKKLLNS